MSVLQTLYASLMPVSLMKKVFSFFVIFRLFMRKRKNQRKKTKFTPLALREYTLTKDYISNAEKLKKGTQAETAREST